MQKHIEKIFVTHMGVKGYAMLYNFRSPMGNYFYFYQPPSRFYVLPGIFAFSLRYLRYTNVAIYPFFIRSFAFFYRRST